MIREQLTQIQNTYPTELTGHAEVSRAMLGNWLEHVLNGIERTKNEINNSNQALRTAEIYLHIAIGELLKMSLDSKIQITSQKECNTK